MELFWLNVTAKYHLEMNLDIKIRSRSGFLFTRAEWGVI